MNFKITYKWLLEYLDTDASPYEIQELLSLSGPSIERVLEGENGDFVFDIEVTSNRVDSASVFGIAQECAAILPRNGKKAVLRDNPLVDLTFKSLVREGQSRNTLPIKVDIVGDDLASRVSAVVLSNVKIQPSPEHIQQRLRMCDVQVINNVVDISNYIMIALGQPNHTFDYDSIAGGHLLIRKSKPGEKIITLDDKEFDLPGDDIVIEDSEGRLIDLAGIMGGKNTAITENTSNVLLFLETYNKQLLRKTSMRTGQRSMAVSYFEKGLDAERVEPTLVHGAKLLMEYAGGQVGSEILDIYPQANEPRHITVSTSYVNSLIGANLSGEDIVSYIEPLGFRTHKSDDDTTIEIVVPTYRYDDVSSPIDIVEEVARIYGYHNVRSRIQKTDPISQPKESKSLFEAQGKIRDYLMATGFNEQYNYSMISRTQIENLDLNLDDHLHIINSISEEIEYLRTSLQPSLIQNMKLNDTAGKMHPQAFFECARVYHKREGELPLEIERLGIISNNDFSTVKGSVENIFRLLHVGGVSFRQAKPGEGSNILKEGTQAVITGKDGTKIGYIGKIKQKYADKNSVSHELILAEVDLKELIAHAMPISLKKINKFARIKLDVTYQSSPDKVFTEIYDKAFQNSTLLQDISVVSIFKNKVTLRFEFQKDNANMTELEAKAELQNILDTLQLTEAQ